ncbi:MAG: fasciclin domain-containing protein [Pseudomonadota bacterium]
MNRAITSVAASLLAGLAFSSNGAEAHESQTITDIVVQSGGEFDRNKKDFDILLNAVLAAELEGVLADTEADFTVLAPDDRAFIRLARDFGYHGSKEAEAFQTIVNTLTVLGEGDPIPVLRNILLYHVSPEGRPAEKISATRVIETALPGATILTKGRRLIDNDPDVRDPRLRLKKGGINASNGVIIPISRVLIPVDIDNTNADELPSIAGIVAASGGSFDHNPDDFDLLLTALQIAELDGAVADRDASLTVLAPNDRAFIRLAKNLGYRGNNEEHAFGVIVEALTQLGGGDPIPLLQTVLLYHVLPEALPVKSVLESETLATLAGPTITPNVETRELGDQDDSFRDPKAALSQRKNFRAANGFITTINRVLIPADLETL